MGALRLLLGSIESWTTMNLPQPLQPLFLSFSSCLVDNIGWSLLIVAIRILITFSRRCLSLMDIAQVSRMLLL
jgi:hypothetical protein